MIFQRLLGIVFLGLAIHGWISSRPHVDILLAILISMIWFLYADVMEIKTKIQSLGSYNARR